MPVLIVALVLLVAHVVVPAADALTADADFAARCAAPGVLRCHSFDTAASIPRNNPLGHESWGSDFGIMANGNNPNVPTIDTTTKASGAGSMKFTFPVGSTSSSAGSWFTHFGPNKTGQISTGERIFIQYRIRWSPELLVKSNWPNSDGAKLSDVGLGDLPNCNPSSPDSVNCPTSCPDQGFEFVIQNGSQRGYPLSYANCNGTAAFVGLAAGTIPPSADSNFQTMITGCSTGPNQTACKRLFANEWMTIKMMLGPIAWNSWGTPIKVWLGREGKPLDLIIDCEASQPVKCTRDFSQAANGWFLVNSNASVYKMGKIYLHPYQTNLQSSLSSANVWYDELVISTQDIADPGVPSSGIAPTAPCCLTLTELGPAPFLIVGAIVMARRWRRRAARRPGDPVSSPAEGGSARKDGGISV
jgi:hypothetical protein